MTYCIKHYVYLPQESHQSKNTDAINLTCLPDDDLAPRATAGISAGSQADGVAKRGTKAGSGLAAAAFIRRDPRIVRPGCKASRAGSSGDQWDTRRQIGGLFGCQTLGMIAL